jgi:nucleotide-binding universal stress UspA family protein
MKTRTRPTKRGTKKAAVAGASGPFRRILVPIDFSPASYEALALAKALAPRSAKLRILHVVEPLVYPASLLAAPPVGGVDLGMLRANAESALARIAARMKAEGVPVDVEARIGRPFEEILLAADEMRADLIVMSALGHSAAAYALLGSVVERVTRRAKCPVLVARSAPGAPKPARRR